jgi:lipopolysaccharide/colanic/teichoic acid biosynthesis glycosyltransferase
VQYVVHVLFLGSLALALALARLPLSFGYPKPPGWVCRSAVGASTGLSSSVWLWLYLGHRAPSYGILPAIAGGLTGGVIAAGAGLVENNAVPSAGVREQVLAHHVAGGLRYPRSFRFKRAFDVVGALIGIVLTLPLWPVIAALVWLEEPGPIFFIKNSVGKGGHSFRQVKFRSMKFGAERETGPVASPVDDPRTLRIGRLLRRWHLDELPELINVLAGAMSLVGPRPLRTVVVRRYLEDVPGFAERHTVQPGIACTAQIEKYYIGPPERLEKDLEYIRSMSLALDLRLLARAVTTTLRGERNSGEQAAAECRRPPSGPGVQLGSPGHRRRTLSPDAKVRPTRPGRRSQPGRRAPTPTAPGSTTPTSSTSPGVRRGSRPA